MRWTYCGAGRGAGLPRAASSSEVEDSRVDSFTAIAVVAAFIAGAIASVAGFGIGSVLTPVLATQLDVRLAIAAVSLPHLAGTFVRFLLVRTHIDRDVLFGFGAASAVGGPPRRALRPLIILLAIGAVIGTLAGGWALRRMPEPIFRRVVGVLLLGLGAYTLARALS